MKQLLVLPLVMCGLVAPASSLAPAQEESADLTLQTLRARRDLWPSRVTVHKDYRLSGGVAIRAGQELVLHELAGREVVLDTGRILFKVPAEDTDVLARARETLANLSPAQRELTWKDLPARPELWPLRVSLTVDLAFQNGLQLPAGSEVVLRGLQGTALDVYTRQGATQFVVQPHETDILVRARARLSLEEEEREPFFVRALAASLEPEEGVAAEGALPGSDLILVYEGRQACPRCAGFAPELARFYERVKSTGAGTGFELVVFSSDATAEAARSHVQEAGIPGRVIAFDRRAEVERLATREGNLLPLVFVFDRSGNLVARNHPGGGSPGALEILADLEKRLEEASGEQE